MFKHLKQFPKIIVTAPQRAGTTITAKMIAHDTGHTYIDEAAIKVRDLGRMKHIVNNKRNFVLQCPSMVCHIPEFAGMKDLAIVMVRRPVHEIVRSQERVNWGVWEASELAKFGITKDENSPPIAQVKYEFWERIKGTVRNAVEVNYRQLSGHPLWVPDERRKHFGIRQTI